MANSAYARSAAALAIRVERVVQSTSEVTTYLKTNLVANALDLWNLEHEAKNLRLFVIRDHGEIRSHLSAFGTPEADYVSLTAGTPEEARELLDLIPDKCVLIIEPRLYESIKSIIHSHLVYPNDRMVVRRGRESLVDVSQAVRLSVEDAPAYVRFGASFNAPQVPLEWARERLQRDIVFGVFSDDSLASIASVVARLPEMAVIMGVETLPEFRGRGFATAASSAATREALTISESCTLFVRSDNLHAVRIYGKLGYRKVGEELWIDIGTGLVP